MMMEAEEAERRMAGYSSTDEIAKHDKLQVGGRSARTSTRR
jgi:hypothetical protein